MLMTMFRFAMRLYPRDHRTMFGAEMADVFDRARADAWRRGAAAGVAFYFREAAGLVIESLRLRLGAPRSRPESWWWSLEAPALAVLFYSLAVIASHDQGVFGFFFPVTYFVAALLAVACAWTVGRICTTLRPPRRYGAIVAAVLVAALIIPAAIRMTEDAQTRALLARRGNVGFKIPGIEIVSGVAMTAPPRMPGLTFTRVVSNGNGDTLTLLHRRSHSSPPYLAVGAVLTGLVALMSRRRMPA